MPYSELVKNFENIRDYMRQFLVYGFKMRDEFDAKSARSYDNEKRRVESWLSDYMHFRQDASGKAVFLSLDSRHIPNNPLYMGWKTSTFTKNDIRLHFLLMDILTTNAIYSIPDILNCINKDYLTIFQDAELPDESTLRKKCQEYAKIGLITVVKQGKQHYYQLTRDTVDYDRWYDALSFFSEDNPLGVVGSFVMDKYERKQSFFSFKHRYFLFSLDSGMVLDVLDAMHERRKVEIELFENRKKRHRRVIVIPLQIWISVQGGRQYLAAINQERKFVYFFRLDSIRKVSSLDIIEDRKTYEAYQTYLKEERKNIWGVSMGMGKLEHIEMTVKIHAKEKHVVKRLHREKRYGCVQQLNHTTWHFSTDVYDAQELLPWIRTFIGRIVHLSCSNKRIVDQFWSDFEALSVLYGGNDDGDVV